MHGHSNIKFVLNYIKCIDFYTCCAGLLGLSLEYEERNEFWPVKNVLQHITTKGHPAGIGFTETQWNADIETCCGQNCADRFRWDACFYAQGYFLYSFFNMKQ